MADVWGALAQSSPGAGVLTDAYTCPTAKQATVEVIIANRGTAALVRLAHSVNGAAIANAQYLLYDFSIDLGESKVTSQITLDADDVLRVYSDTGTVNFNVNGIEEDK
jgi:hypothetical protein